MKKLTDICDIQYGYAFDSKKFTEDNSYPPIVRIRDIKRGFSETYYSGEYPKQYVLHAGDLLVGMDGEFNIARWKDVDALLNQRVCKLTAKEGTNEEYLRFAMIKSLKAIEDKTAFVTVKHLSAKELNKLELNVPSFREQDNVAKILTKLEKLILLREEELKSLDKIIKARFVEMFGDAVANPMKWPIKKLKELSVQINSGNTPKGGSENYVEEGITFFRSQNVWKDRLEMDDIVYIDAETHASMKRSSLKHGDILMTKTGRINTENSSLGRAALYDGEDDMANVNGHVYFIRLKEGVNNKFVLRILVSPEYRELIRSVCVGGIDKRQLNKEHIEDFPIICPPSDRVNEYVAFVEQVDKSKVAVQRALDETQLLFDSLMQKYFG